MFTLDDTLTKKSNVLEVKVKNYQECGYCLDTDNREVLKIPFLVWSQWIYISQKMGDKEWGGVFWVKDNAISHFKIPKQEVTSVECEFKEEIGGNGIVHSHHDMGASHSPQDDRHARNLYDYSIVLSNRAGYEATKRIKLPCGGLGYVKIELHLVNCPDIDLSKIRESSTIESSSLIRDRGQIDSGLADYPCDECVTHDCERCQLLDASAIPCDRCRSFKCKTCHLTAGRNIEGVIPFCDFCGDIDECDSCEGLAQYLANYPEEKKYFEYLYDNKA